MSIKIVLADDHEVVRSGLSRLLENSEIQIIDQAADGDEAVAKTLDLWVSDINDIPQWQIHCSRLRVHSKLQSCCLVSVSQIRV